VPETPLRLMLPGTLCDRRLFEPMLQAWSSMGVCEGHRVVSLHNLAPETGAWWRKELARLPERFDVLSFSLGAVLALQLLRMEPDRIRRLVLVCGNALAGTEIHRQRVAAQLALWKSQGPAAVATQMLEQASPRACADSRIRQCLVDMAGDTPLSAFTAQGEVNATRPEGLSCLARWCGPLLLVSGAQDPWCGADKQELMLSARPDAQWHEIPQCGHYLPLEWPRGLAELTHTFFSENPNPDKG
jgi:pimeloyl-ACP methyl ester carboxylesterase